MKLSLIGMIGFEPRPLLQARSGRVVTAKEVNVAGPALWRHPRAGEAPLGINAGLEIALPTSSGKGGAMAHPNEELVRRGYEAFNDADVETLRQVFADTTIFHEPVRSPMTCWPTMSTWSGCTAPTRNEMGAVFAA
jgi:hypothetical protein